VQSLSELLVENRLCLNNAEVQSLLDAALANPEAKGFVRGMIYAVAMDYAVAKIGSLPLGLRYAKAAVDSDPENVPLRINLVRLLLATGNKAEALQQYQSFSQLRVAPKDKADVELIGHTLRGTEKNTGTP
jgi:predicted Zn-dependent protease